MPNDPHPDGELIAASGRGRSPRGIRTALVTAVALVLAGALILSGGLARTRSPSRAVSGRRQLIGLLGVLRRPQTSDDLRAPSTVRLLSAYRSTRRPWRSWGVPDLRLIRTAVTPWRERVSLIPVKPTRSGGQEALLWATPSFIECCATAADLKTFGEVNNAGAATGRGVSRGTRIARFLAVVPDGVAKVQLGHLVMRVRDNLAAAQADRDLVGALPVMFWFGTGGSALRRIGDLVGRYRSVAISRPGPETAATRAAERDPSTPNRAWVTPRVGGPHTAFTVHFRVLLNAADYAYALSGGGCRSLWGAQGSPDDSRGHIWSDEVVPVGGRTWCRGTYLLRVSVADLGPAGAPKRPPAPFGTATFVVR